MCATKKGTSSASQRVASNYSHSLRQVPTESKECASRVGSGRTSQIEDTRCERDGSSCNLAEIDLHMGDNPHGSRRASKSGGVSCTPNSADTMVIAMIRGIDDSSLAESAPVGTQALRILTT